MASKRRIKKKRIKEDQLVTYTVKASHIVQKYFAHVISGVAVLVIAVAVILFTAHSRRAKLSESERDMALAMSQYNARDVETAATSFSQIVDRYGGYQAGKVSRYFLAKSLLTLARYDEAMAAFEQYLDEADETAPFTDAAVIGKAMCLDGLHNFTAAAEVLEQLSQSLDPDDPRYFDVLFQAANYYEKAGAKEKALEYYRQVSEKASGPLKNRASISVATLN